MRIIDLSPAIDRAAPVWPGDAAFAVEPNWSIDAGDSVTVGTVRTTAHVGAHIDAPSHVIGGAPSAEAIPLEACVGECVVVDVSDLVDASVSPRGAAPAEMVRARIAALAGEARVERLLLRHYAPGTHRVGVWDEDIPGVDPALMSWFGEQGGRLVGLDMASFDPVVCPELPGHKAGLAHGVVLLEGLDLTRAPEGVAELIALPLPWCGADASPVRAVLRVPEPDA